MLMPHVAKRVHTCSSSFEFYMSLGQVRVGGRERCCQRAAVKTITHIHIFRPGRVLWGWTAAWIPESESEPETHFAGLW